MKTTPVRGCLDYLPREMELRQQVLEKILKTYKNNGFLQIKTPILEHLENLSSGDSGDNAKMMFKTIKRGEKLDLSRPNLTERDIAEEGLRYDLTVPLARFFTANRDNLPVPFKSIQADDSFRAERPQEGRNRQFTQCDVDIWGEPSSLGEMEIITTTMEAYKNIGLPGVVCRISSRKILVAIVLACGFSEKDVNDVCVIVDKLDKIGLDGCQKELLAKGFDAAATDKLARALRDIEVIGLEACTSYGASETDVAEVRALIEAVRPLIPEGYSIKFDISIVRGQGYYTGCVFEMYCYESGYRGAIGGGGRYDKMYEKFSGSPLAAVGYGLGLDSVLLVLKKLGKDTLFQSKKLALVFDKDDDYASVIRLKNKFKADYDVSIFPYPKNFKEFLRRVKLNGFGYLAKTKAQDVQEI